jgi:hypothetical protein
MTLCRFNENMANLNYMGGIVWIVRAAKGTAYSSTLCTANYTRNSIKHHLPGGPAAWPPPTATQLIPVRAKSFPSPSRPCEEEASPPRRSSRDAPAVKLIHGRVAISSSIMHRARRPNDLYFLDAAKKNRQYARTNWHFIVFRSICHRSICSFAWAYRVSSALDPLICWNAMAEFCTRSVC